jgi:hypothetical protein
MGSRWSQTPEPTTANYAGVVRRESVRILFTYAAMGLSVMAGDIKNAYLQAPTSENRPMNLELRMKVKEPRSSVQSMSMVV